MSQSPSSLKSVLSSKSSKSKTGQPKPTKRNRPCPQACALIPKNVPGPHETQRILHPLKDVFVLKVSKVSAQGDRKSKLELELVSPKGPEKKSMARLDSRETQCDPDPPRCCCCTKNKKQEKA